MAIIQLGDIVSDIKGSIGGTTFSRNRAGLTAKQRITGRRVSTQLQGQRMQESQNTTYAWSQLSYSQKSAFNAYALANEYTDRYGTVKPLTGFQWYKQLSQASKYLTGNQLITPPTYTLPDALPTFSVVAGDDVLRVVWSTPIDTDVITVFVYATPPIRGQARKQRGAYRQLDVRSLDVSSAFSIRNKWNDAFNLDYDSIAANGVFTINVLIYPVHKTSFNTGLYQSANGSRS